MYYLYFTVFIFFFGTAYVLAYGLRNGAKAELVKEGGWAFFAYLDEMEEECGQIEDGLIYTAFFAVFVLWFYLLNLFFSAFMLKYLSWVLVLFCFTLMLGAVIPVSFLSWLGGAFGQFVRGASRSTGLLFETLLDFVSVSVIIIRFFVQNVSFVFIFVAFFELYESMVNNQTFFSQLVTPHITWGGYWAGEFNQYYNMELVFLVFQQGVGYFYYVAHLTVTYIAQLAIYVILSFWIFFFLYTTFTLPSKDKFFYYKSYVLLEE